MKIAVCIKQVPINNKIEINMETGVLIRDAAKAKINPYDLYALEAAVELKEKTGGEVTCFTMGPEKAKEVLRYSYTVGVDKGVLLSDQAFAGADVFATAFTLSEGIMASDDFDVIICGKHTIDGDTGQVGPALGEHLESNHVYGVISIDEVKDNSLIVSQRLDDEIYQVQTELPILLVIDQEKYIPRLPSLKLKLGAKKKEIVVLSKEDLSNKESNYYGLNGSPTKVEKSYLPERTLQNKMITGDAKEIVGEIIKIIKDND